MKANTFFCYHLELEFKGIYSHEEFQQAIHFISIVDDLEMVSMKFIIGDHSLIVSDSKKDEQAMQDLLKIWNLMEEDILYKETVDSNKKSMINLKLPKFFKVNI